MRVPPLYVERIWLHAISVTFSTAMNDEIGQRFSEISWAYAPGDLKPLGELERRIATAGRGRALITYSDLVAGVPFDLPNLQESPRLIEVSDWQELDRAIVGDYLGYISMQSWEHGQYFASALVVNQEDRLPGKGFAGLLQELGLDYSEAAWLRHVEKAHEFYSR
jgi:hypothetical protein